jgi:hypothetical protein
MMNALLERCKVMRSSLKRTILELKFHESYISADALIDSSVGASVGSGVGSDVGSLVCNDRV